ncbi:phosphotransferase [Streptomyces sp. NPDC093097]|uniref:phosphotransferase n=1 Tax=Streptomyces sp. NPDC093097 TaxID=3366027 RepID=UPI00380BAA51
MPCLPLLALPQSFTHEPTLTPASKRTASLHHVTFSSSRAPSGTPRRVSGATGDRGRGQPPHTRRRPGKSLPDPLPHPRRADHGDLVPPNIHIDAAGRPVAVLDFGFYTTAGDPAFEAAVTAAVWDMYGPYAEEHTAELTGLFARELGYAPETLTAYQAAYALTTYDLFGLDDSDGHFRWCAEQLRRNAVFSA